MKPTLLVLAAGMGSRYGGLKQIDPVGLNDETILEFSVFDAIKAGFGKVVFIIRKSIEKPFREKIGVTFEHYTCGIFVSGIFIPNSRSSSHS